MAAPEKRETFVDTISTAIRATQDLRVSVGHVFEQLNDGIKPSDDNDGKQKKFISEFHQRLLTVVKHFTDLEKSANNLPPNLTTPGLGNTSLLTLDAIAEKTPTYQHLLQTYKWSNKVHHHASLAVSALSHHSLKRSQNFALNSAKRPRKLGGTSQAASQQQVNNTIEKMDKTFPEMNIKLTRPIGSAAVLHITLGMTLKAIVVLRGLVIEWVSVKGYDEDFFSENGKLDIWSRSKHEVFRKVTDHTHSSMQHYYSPALIPEVAVFSFLKWLRSYSTLFSSSCVRCGKFLKDNLPPTWRHTLSYDVYHEGCRP